MISLKHAMTAFLRLSLILCSLGSCSKQNQTFSPQIKRTTFPQELHSKTPVFSKIAPQEQDSSWAEELVIGERFSREFDFYRAITSFKRAKILLGPTQKERLLEINYNIFLSYYLARKYTPAIEYFEKERLLHASPSFKAFESMLIIAYHSYLELQEYDRAETVLKLLRSRTPSLAEKLQTYSYVHRADFESIANLSSTAPYTSSLHSLTRAYKAQKKSVQKAKVFNALLPGAGYYYVGQKSTAFTSFALNAIFIATTYQLFHRGYTAPGLFTLSLEMGWYFGGINGAAESANEYNERLYGRLAKKALNHEQLFPILSIEHMF